MKRYTFIMSTLVASVLAGETCDQVVPKLAITAGSFGYLMSTADVDEYNRCC